MKALDHLKAQSPPNDADEARSLGFFFIRDLLDLRLSKHVHAPANADVGTDEINEMLIFCAPVDNVFCFCSIIVTILFYLSSWLRNKTNCDPLVVK